MAGATQSAVLLKDVQSLFGFGVVRDLSDRQLLDRFLSADPTAAEAAFTFLVERHGPMVLHVCQQVLEDSHDAEDAFQATFLTFLGRARSIKNRDSVASWLFGVATRVARRARYATIIRRFHERQAGELAPQPASQASENMDWVTAMQEEIARLPERYREPIVLCHLEGLSTAAAAQRLACAHGTILSRLARGREQLRARLSRRGQIELAGLLAAGRPPRAATAVLQPALLHSTVQAAAHSLAGRTALKVITVPGFFTLVQATQRTLLMSPIPVITALVTTAVVVTAMNLPVAAPAPAGRVQAVATQPGPKETQEKTRAIPERIVQARELEDTLLKILERDHEFKDSRWPYAIKVRAVRGKALIDATFQHRTGGKGEEFDGVIHAKRAVLRVDIEAKTARFFLENAEMQRFREDASHLVSRSVLEMPIPPGDLLDTERSVVVRAAASPPRGHITTPDAQSLSLVYSADGKTLATGGYSGVVHLWDMQKGERIGYLKGEKSTIRSVTFAPGNKIVACVNDAGLVRLWEVATGKLQRTLPGLSQAIRQAARSFMLDALAFAPDGRLLAVSGFGPPEADLADRFYEIRIFDLQSGRPRWSHMGRGENACALAFAPDGATLARAGWKSVKLWDSKTGEPVRTLTPVQGTIFAVAFTPDGRTLIGGGNIPGKDADRPAGLVTLWNVGTGQIIRSLEGHTGGVHAAAVSPDGRFLASGGNSEDHPSGGNPSELRLWDIATGRLVWKLAGEGGVIRSLAFAPDGKTLVYCDDQSIGVVNAQTGKTERILARF